MENIYNLLNKPKNNELKKTYETGPREIREMMDRIYKCAFRFNLLDIQTEYLLHEAISPFFGGKIINVIEEEKL